MLMSHYKKYAFRQLRLQSFIISCTTLDAIKSQEIRHAYFFSHVLIVRNIFKSLNLGHLLHEHSKQIFHINSIKLNDSKVP